MFETRTAVIVWVMTDFRQPSDIGNRALEHVGNEMLGALGFNEASSRAQHVGFVYDKLRKAELERNVWTFATRRTALRAIDTNTLLLVPALWAPTATYFVGSIVADQSGYFWISRTRSNLNNDPLISTLWEPYFGPMTVALYATSTSYFAGELVYTASGDGTHRVYLSLISGNSDNPATATAWSSTGVYFKNQVVTRSSVAYMSLTDLNIGQDPATAPALWSSLTTYSAGTKVGGSNGIVYQSVGSGNISHDPTLDDGTLWTDTGVLNPWTTVFTGGTGSVNWLQIGGAEFPMGVGLTTLNIVYPLGAGPLSQSNTNNIYRLPAGYLREAGQDPKAGSSSWFGAPTNSIYNDWVFESKYIVTRCTGIIVFRFVADITDVSEMKSLFCECLAAQIALAICEPLTQSTAKISTIAAVLKKKEYEAVTVNAIEAGSEESPLDDWLACRG